MFRSSRRPKIATSAGTVLSAVGPGPLFTLLTDFGLGDSYVAEMKAVLLCKEPFARIVDVTHLVPPQDVLAASILLDGTTAAFEPGTIHIAVVDPGVGTGRQILAVQIRRQWVICPDNGLITWAWRRSKAEPRAFQILVDPVTKRAVDDSATSHTFHGRDIMAPFAAALARSTRPSKLMREIRDPVFLDIWPARSLEEARIVQVDHFGNLTTNVPAEMLHGHEKLLVQIARRRIGGLSRTYADVAPGRPLVLIGSGGLLEIAIRNGSAAKTLGGKVGDTIRITSDRTFAEPP